VCGGACNWEVARTQQHNHVSRHQLTVDPLVRTYVLGKISFRSSLFFDHHPTTTIITTTTTTTTHYHHHHHHHHHHLASQLPR
jgi:hypothetical protein